MKFNDPKNGELTAQEQNLLAHIGPSFGVPIQKLSILDPSIAALYIQEVLPIITVEVLYDMTKQLGNSVREAVQQTDSSYSSEALKQIEENERSIRAEVEDLRKQYGTISEALKRYETFKNNLPDPQGDSAKTDAPIGAFPIRMN